MNKKLISALIVAVAAPVIAYFISEDLRCMRYLKEPDEVRHREVRAIDMSEKDRMKDFDILWNVVSEGIPAVYAYPDAFGYDIGKSEDRYREAVRNAGDDVEYFCVLQSVLNDVPSAHTAFFFPDYNLVTEYNCMASEVVKTDPYLRDTADLWMKSMRHRERKSRTYQFNYIDGEYLFEPDASEVRFSYDRSTCILRSAGGITPDEFVHKYLSSSPFCYDDEHHKMYRRNIYFNDSNGEKITLELEKEDGSVTRSDVFFDLCDEYLFVNQPYLHGVYEKPDDIIDIRYADDQENIVYLRVDDLDNDRGNELYQKIKKYCGGDRSVILDLRNNGGGTIEYTSEYLYAPLFSEPLDIHETEYIMKSSGNRDFFRGVYYFMNLKVFGMKKLSKDEASDVYGYLGGRKMFEYDVDMHFNGQSDSTPFVCVLVSDRTASSADYFVSAVKPLENVIVIGENTAGEKTGGQFMAMLPESRLVYYYNAAVCFNDDGTDNSLYGTAPEIRCRQSKDGYITRCAISGDGKDPGRFDNRLQWDDVLKKAYDICRNR